MLQATLFWQNRPLKSLLLCRIMTILLTALLIWTPATFAEEHPFLFSLDALKDPGSLAVKLQDTRAPFSKFLAAQLSTQTRQLLDGYDGYSSPSTSFQKALLADLNQLLQGGTLYEAKRFSDIELSEQTQALLEQNPQNGEDLIHLNRSLLADAYPHELATPAEQQSHEEAKGLERCRENLRNIKRAIENHHTDGNERCQWLSELCPQYLDKKALICPADKTAGVPGVLTEGAADPTLPCSYLYEFRLTEKTGQEFLLAQEGDMIPIVRCQHHFLNLSVSGKLYRNGRQRAIYNNSTVKITSAQVNPSGNLHAQLKEQLGEAFLESPKGKELLKQLLPGQHFSQNSPEALKLIAKPMPDLAFTNLSGEPVKLDRLRGKLVLLNSFSTDSTACGPALQHLEKLLANYDTGKLEAIGIATGDSVQAIKGFQEKYQLSMPIWVDKNNQIQALLNRDTSKSHTELITIFLNPELVVEEVFMNFDPQSLERKIERLIESNSVDY